MQLLYAFAIEKVYMRVEKSKDGIGLTRLCAPLREVMAHFKGVLMQRPRNNGQGLLKAMISL